MLRLPESANGARHRYMVLLIVMLGVAALHSAGAVTVEPTAAAQAAHRRQLLVSTNPSPSTPPKSTPFDSTLQVSGTPDVPHTDKRVVKRGAACDSPNQIHLTLWTATSVLVSWVTCDYNTGPGVVQARATPGTTSLHYWRAEWECERPSYYPTYAEAETKDTEDDAVKTSENSVDAEVAFRRKHKQSRNYDKPSESHYKQGSDNYGQHKQYRNHNEPSYSHYKQGNDNDGQHKQPHNYDEPSESHYKQGYDYYGQHKQPHNYDEPSESPYKKGGDNYGQPDTDRCGKPMQAKGVTTSYFYDYSGIDATNNYASGIIHHVLIKDLLPGATYFYRVCGDKDCEVKEFKAPAQTFPLRMGVMADPGMTYNTSVMLDKLTRDAPDLVALIGDFVYADQWRSWTQRGGGMTWQPKWDVWGNLFEPLLAHTPLLHINGNHEIEGDINATKQATGTRFRNYNTRFPVPQTADRRANGPTTFNPATPDSKWENLYYAVEVPGIFKAIHITSYSLGQPMSKDEEQYIWLEQELKNTDRTVTPWLMVNWHSPWYNTYVGHYKENDAMRQTYEGLMLKYKVDIQFHGHVHAYERKHPIANNTVNSCGPVSITIGDGGNVEGTYKDFIDTAYTTKAYCNSSAPNFGAPGVVTSYQPKLFTMFEKRWCGSGVYGPNCFCYTQQPDWSAYREPSYGYGILTFESATEATWTWSKNQQSRFEIGDQVKIYRDGSNSPSCGAIDCQCIN